MKRILVADDQPHVLRVLKLALESQQYEVNTAPNGEEALRQITLRAPDVLITDVSMPKMDGRELCRAIQSHFPDRSFLIVVLTSHLEREERGWVSEVDNIEFQEKPVSPKRLIARLNQYFQQDQVEN